MLEEKEQRKRLLQDGVTNVYLKCVEVRKDCTRLFECVVYRTQSTSLCRCCGRCINIKASTQWFQTESRISGWMLVVLSAILHSLYGKNKHSALTSRRTGEATNEPSEGAAFKPSGFQLWKRRVASTAPFEARRTQCSGESVARLPNHPWAPHNGAKRVHQKESDSTQPHVRSLTGPPLTLSSSPSVPEVRAPRTNNRSTNTCVEFCVSHRPASTCHSVPGHASHRPSWATANRRVDHPHVEPSTPRAPRGIADLRSEHSLWTRSPVEVLLHSLYQTWGASRDRYRPSLPNQLSPTCALWLAIKRESHSQSIGSAKTCSSKWAKHPTVAVTELMDRAANVKYWDMAPSATVVMCHSETPRRVQHNNEQKFATASIRFSSAAIHNMWRRQDALLLDRWWHKQTATEDNCILESAKWRVIALPFSAETSLQDHPHTCLRVQNVTCVVPCVGSGNVGTPNVSSTTETTVNLDSLLVWTHMRADSTWMTFLRTAKLWWVTLSNHLWTEITEPASATSTHATWRKSHGRHHGDDRKMERPTQGSGFCWSPSVPYSAASWSALFTEPQCLWCMPKCLSKIDKTLIKIRASFPRSPRAPLARAKL